MIPQAKTYVSLSAVYSRNSAPAITARLAARPLLSFGIMLATIVLAFTLHVLWCMRSPARLMAERREMGFFLLQGVWPTFYADVTDIFMSSRRDRGMVDSPRDPSSRSWAVAWPSSACMAHNRESANHCCSAGIVLWESALLSLYPFSFLEMDGYNILADLLAMPTLRQQALAFIPRLPHRLRSGKMPDRSEWIQLGYLTLSMVPVLAHLDAIVVKPFAWRSGP